MRVAALAVAVLCAGSDLWAAAEALPVGRVIEQVRCLADPRQTYALYLPSSYDGGRPWPILYTFDARARGGFPVRLFSQAAERLGYIVAGSNNSRNGPIEPVLEAMQAVWVDTHQRLAVDPVRVYTAGMSGATFPALLLAFDRGLGVVAFGGALDPSQLPKTERRIDWLGVAGDGDFNFGLTKSVVEAMVERGAVARFASFEGGHAWPPEPVAARALSWLELGAMRSGHRPREAAFIDELFEQGSARARDLLGQGRLDDAAEENAALAREFAGLKPVESLAAEARRLRATAEARKARKRERNMAERDRSETLELLALRTRVEDAAEDDRAQPPPSLDTSAEREAAEDPWILRRRLDGHIARLTRDLESADAERRIVAQWVLDRFYIATCVSAGGQQRGRRRFKAALADFDICSTMRPENPWPAYEKARTHAARGDRKAAVAALEDAIALGFSEAARLAEDPEWAELHDDPDYLALRERLRTPP